MMVPFGLAAYDAARQEHPIVLLEDVRGMRARKQHELAYYIEQKTKLELRLTIIREELRLTDSIIKLIERDKIKDIA